MRRPAPILLALAAQSCTWSEVPAPVLSEVDPPAAPRASATELAVLGSDFVPDVTVDFDAPGRSRINASFDLKLVHPDGTKVPLSGVTLVSQGEIRATLDPGASPQTYDLLLVDPRGRTARLPQALQIYQGDCATNNTPCISGNPCTTGDTCQGHRCLPGTPVPDGTPCQLVCSAPVETCRGGSCTAPPGGCP